jgi:hypothetical protein
VFFREKVSGESKQHNAQITITTTTKATTDRGRK